ncbi:MAG TPA: ribonuclease III domain-containing protein [Syntrophomonadaceae bacterium]|jgi:ribonuclease-3 family protein|nr:ribonuclease III domain-containing protein [Syntrophomonadaceae bacterium]
MHEPLDERTLDQYSPLLLAYVGDAVYELMVRTRMVAAGQRPVREIHLDAVQKVKAEHQARVIKNIFSQLPATEQDIVRRGRNAKSTPPKNADMQEYRLSTGFEALIGYLYLKGDQRRLQELLELSEEIV